MYYKRKVDCEKIDLTQENSELVKQLRKEVGNFCVVWTKELHTPIRGTIRKVDTYNFNVEKSRVSYKNVVHISVYNDSHRDK
jgi:hypothetical protein